MTWKAEEIPQLKGFTIEWAEAGNYILSRRNQLFLSADLEPPFTPFASVDAPGWKQAASRSRLAQRLLRFMVTNVVRIADGGLFVTFDKSVGIVTDNKYQELKGLVRPCRVLRSACAVDQHGDIYFGEYLANDERGEMRVYKFVRGGDTVQIVYTFPP
ncbi:MAG TPA: hypothetical protein VK468_03770, partial [Pyrinomonadaceae bacterium]|nr:hypothetical protein [Pyrinomonadaceae bacterium]